MSPRGKKKKSPPTAEPSQAITIISPSNITDAPWWSKLNEKEHTLVLSESHQLADALLNYGRSKLAIGEHLTKLQAVLTPHNAWLKYLKTYHFKIRTAQHYIVGFKNAASALPEPILKEAMARGMNIIGDSDERPLGTYTQAVAALPPPSSPTKAQAVTYLDQLENVRKHTREAPIQSAPVVTGDPRLAQKIVYKTFSHWLKLLPADRSGKAKMNFIKAVVGMFLAEAGISNPQTFSPQAIPEDFRIPRGRKPGFSPKKSVQ